VWFVPPSNKTLITKIQKGAATLAMLQTEAVQLGLRAGDLAAHGCPETGNGCVNVYAASIPGVTPAAFITWFQAAAAARNSLKRLPTNQEWQVAALGTPDPDTADDRSTTCNTLGGEAVLTGSRSACVSDVGAFDMVANLTEWVADWADAANSCTAWPGSYGSDESCVGGPGFGYSNLPAAMVRGGYFAFYTAGVFAVNATYLPSMSGNVIGFRCAR
jgi:formylglycine-generating enzyme required for sulfatase activity